MSKSDYEAATKNKWLQPIRIGAEYSKNAEEIASILKGNTCGPRNTSCADQFSKALMRALENN